MGLVEDILEDIGFESVLFKIGGIVIVRDEGANIDGKAMEIIVFLVIGGIIGSEREGTVTEIGLIIPEGFDLLEGGLEFAGCGSVFGYDGICG